MAEANRKTMFKIRVIVTKTLRGTLSLTSEYFESKVGDDVSGIREKSSGDASRRCGGDVSEQWVEVVFEGRQIEGVHVREHEVSSHGVSRTRVCKIVSTCQQISSLWKGRLYK